MWSPLTPFVLWLEFLAGLCLSKEQAQAQTRHFALLVNDTQNRLMAAIPSI